MKNLQLEVDDKILLVVFQPYPILEKSEKINILKCAKPLFVDSNFFLVFSHKIELRNIVRIKERNIYIG